MRVFGDQRTSISETDYQLSMKRTDIRNVTLALVFLVTANGWIYQVGEGRSSWLG